MTKPNSEDVDSVRVQFTGEENIELLPINQNMEEYPPEVWGLPLSSESLDDDSQNNHVSQETIDQLANGDARTRMLLEYVSKKTSGYERTLQLAVRLTKGTIDLTEESETRNPLSPDRLALDALVIINAARQHSPHKYSINSGMFIQSS